MSYASRSSATLVLDASAANATNDTMLGGKVSEVGVTTWREIYGAATLLVNRCVLENNKGGFVVLNSSTRCHYVFFQDLADLFRAPPN